MDHYVTGGAIKALREKKGLTQAQLGEILTVSDKAVSKWETGRGLPDISLLEPLALALGVSVPEPFRQYAEGPVLRLPGLRKCAAFHRGSGSVLLWHFPSAAGGGGTGGSPPGRHSAT